jgi:beta-galactosidase
MAVNGKPTKLRGGCIHHDNGLLGAASFDAAEDRKVRLLKARGYNAVRPSHNPYSAAFLSACDRHGLMVVGETFDAWRQPKLPQDYSVYFDDQWRSDLIAIVMSARNHPSIILWSIGNEIPGRNLPGGVETQWQLGNLVHELDPSRPVTAAINDFVGKPVVASQNAARPGRAGMTDQTSSVFLDATGYNYKLLQYESDHKAYPQRILFGTESFPKDVFAIWDLTDRSDYLMGDFVWTAMDYLGEAGIGGATYASPTNAHGMAMPSAWPYVVSDCGDIDLIGGRKGASFARDVVWGLSALEIAVQTPPPDGKIEVARPWGWSNERQSWTWPGSEGKTLAVRTYTSGDKVELHLNGHLLESRDVTVADLKHIEFKAVYAPGTLEAVAFKGGAEIGRRRLATAGTPAAIRLAPETKIGGAGRGDVSHVAIEIVDAHGQWVPDTIEGLQLSITGPAELIGFGSANPCATGSFQSPAAQTWNGRALAILRGKGKTGQVRIVVTGKGLKGASATLHFA